MSLFAATFSTRDPLHSSTQIPCHARSYDRNVNQIIAAVPLLKHTHGGEDSIKSRVTTKTERNDFIPFHLICAKRYQQQATNQPRYSREDIRQAECKLAALQCVCVWFHLLSYVFNFFHCNLLHRLWACYWMWMNEWIMFMCCFTRNKRWIYQWIKV